MAGLTCERGELLPVRRRLLPNYSAKKPLHLQPQEQRRFLTPGRNPHADSQIGGECSLLSRKAACHTCRTAVRSATISIYCPPLDRVPNGHGEGDAFQTLLRRRDQYGQGEP